MRNYTLTPQHAIDSWHGFFRMPRMSTERLLACRSKWMAALANASACNVRDMQASISAIDHELSRRPMTLE